MAGLYILAALVVIFTNTLINFTSPWNGLSNLPLLVKQPLVVLLVQQSWSLCDLVLRVVSSQMSQGLGSAPIAAAAAKTEEPVEQGLISMTGTFIDTIIICTLTGLLSL